MNCIVNEKPPEEQIFKVRELVQKATEQEVQRYLEESMRCFAAGAYSMAIVAGWCAVARYLRLLIRAFGFDVAKGYYWDDEKSPKPVPELDEWDGPPLYRILDRDQLYIFPQPLGPVLKDFWKKRCRYAHPHGEFATPEEVLKLLTDTEWLMIRTVAQEKLQNFSVLLECAEDPKFKLNQDRASKLTEWVRKDQWESLANVLLSKLLSANCGIPYERLISFWEALKQYLSKDSKICLMEKLSSVLSDDRSQIDKALDVVQMAQLIFWEEAYDQNAIWDYFDKRLADDSMNRGIAARLRQFAPPSYREKAEKALPNVY